MLYHHQVSGLSTVKSTVVYPRQNYPRQHDNHLIEWLKASFNLTIQWNDYAVKGDRWIAFKGDWDLDCKYATDDSIYGAALEFCACYDGELFDRLIELETGL